MGKICFSVILSLCLTGLCSALIDIRYQELRVTAHVFSGRPDPVWILTIGDPNFRAFQSRLQGHHSSDLASRLGYSGFSIDFIRAHSTYTITVGRCTNPELETYLLDHLKDEIPEGEHQPLADNVIEYIRSDIENCGQ